MANEVLNHAPKITQDARFELRMPIYTKDMPETFFLQKEKKYLQSSHFISKSSQEVSYLKYLCGIFPLNSSLKFPPQQYIANIYIMLNVLCEKQNQLLLFNVPHVEEKLLSISSNKCLHAFFCSYISACSNVKLFFYIIACQIAYVC